MPILDNCSGVWGHTKHYNIESVQLRALRYFLGVHRFTPILAIQGDSGWFPSFYRHQLNMLRLWNHLVTISDDIHVLTKLAFMWDLEKSNNQNWSHHVKLLLQSIDMSTCFLNREVCNLNLAEIKLQQKFVNDWQNELQSVSKLRTNRSFKSDFNLEKYVTMDIPKPHRSILAQFRCGVLPIRIETRRFRGRK